MGLINIFNNIRINLASVRTTSLRMSSDFAHIRRHYRDPDVVFDLKDLESKDPIKQFDAWFQAARKNLEVKEPNAMCLATSTLDGRPSARMVLLKDFDERGFVFFTNYNSKKGKELTANPQASIVFNWDMMSRQVRVDGKVVRVSKEESASYFTKRPLKSRISAYISDQSKVIGNKEYIVNLQQEALAK